VERNRINVVIALLERLAVPFEISRHANLARAASNQLNRRVHGAHLQGSIPGLEAILFGGHVTKLPWSVHFIAKAPILYLVRFLEAVMTTQIAPARPALDVAIFHKVRGSLRGSCAKIDGQ